jgi:hypothetical protein
MILLYRYEESNIYKEQPSWSLRKLGGNVHFISIRDNFLKKEKERERERENEGGDREAEMIHN